MNDESEIAIGADSGLSIRSAADISDALTASFGKRGLVLTEGELGSEFFNLRSGLTGEMFQKSGNYRVKLAIALLDPDAHGERFAELVREHATHPLIRFVESSEGAKAWLLS